MYLRFSVPVPKDRALFRYDQSREIVAKISATMGDPEFVRYLLWMADKPNTARSGLAPFRFTTSRRGKSLDIIALGQSAVEEMLTKAHLLSIALSQEFGSPMREEREIGVCSVELGRTVSRYRIPRMIIQKYQYKEKFREAEQEYKSGKPSSVLRDHVEAVIMRDLLRQAELMAIDMPEDTRIGDIELTDFKPVKVCPRRYNLSAAVRFSSTHHLGGHWSVGHLAARGYGRILTEYHQ